MNMYKIKISLQSPLGTELMADTIWGHICYGILYNEGEDKLKNFLELYKNNEPPLILSTPFPENMLPLPKINLEKKEIETIEQYQNIKKTKKIKFLPLDKLITNKQIALDNLIDEEIKKYNNQNENEYYIKNETITKMRNSIDRLSGTTKEDSIFQVEEYWTYKIKSINHKNEFIFPVYDIYVLSSFDKKETLNLFKMGFSLGYGADTSTGKGKILVYDKIEEFNFPNNGDTALALAPFIPTIDDYDNFENLNFEEKKRGLFADVWTKYPKVHNSNPKMTNPFKKPIIFYREGATFKFKDKSKKPFFIGKCVDNIHHIPEIMQYAIAPVFWLNLD